MTVLHSIISTNNSSKRCSQKCIYFPTNYSSLVESKEIYDGIIEREAVYLCQYDNHRIKEFRTCPFYKEKQKGDILD